MEVSLYMHDWLNIWPLVTELNPQFFFSPHRSARGAGIGMKYPTKPSNHIWVFLAASCHPEAI